MVLLFSATLGISIVGMATLLTVKAYELKTGRVLLEGLRPACHRLLHRARLFVAHHVPMWLRLNAGRLFTYIAQGVHRLTAQTIVYVEYWLQRALDFLHLTTHIVHPTTPASAFLREVAEHKKNLLKQTRPKRILVQK